MWLWASYMGSVTVFSQYNGNYRRYYNHPLLFEYIYPYLTHQTHHLNTSKRAMYTHRRLCAVYKDKNKDINTTKQI